MTQVEASWTIGTNPATRTEIRLTPFSLSAYFFAPYPLSHLPVASYLILYAINLHCGASYSRELTYKHVFLLMEENWITKRNHTQSDF